MLYSDRTKHTQQGSKVFVASPRVRMTERSRGICVHNERVLLPAVIAVAYLAVGFPAFVFEPS